MAVIVGLSAKGSPGVSLGMWGLLQCWPRPAVGFEADVSGGSWAVRHGLTCEPGLASLAATPDDLNLHSLRAHSFQISADKHVVCAPTQGRVVSNALGWLNDRFASWPDNEDLLVDAGRVTPQHLRENGLLRRADTILLFAGTDGTDVGPAADLLIALAAVLRHGASVRIVLVGGGEYSMGEVAEFLCGVVGNRYDCKVGGSLSYDRARSNLIVTSKHARRLAHVTYGPIAFELAAATAHRSVTFDQMGQR